MPQSTNMVKALIEFLPRTFTVEKDDSTTDTIGPIDWHPGLEGYIDADPPFGRFGLLPARPLRDSRVGPKALRAEAVSPDETYTFNDGTLDYQVDEWDIVPGSVTVTGTLNGTPNHTFVEGTDYEVVSTGGTVLLNTIRFLTTGDNPDDGTQITIAYSQYKRDHQSQAFHRPIYRLEINVQDLYSGDAGATQRYMKSEIGDMLIQSLYSQLLAKRGEELTSNVRIRNLTTGIPIEVGKAEDVGRWGLDLELTWQQLTITNTENRAGYLGQPTSTE